MTEDVQRSPTGRRLWTAIVALAVFGACVGLLIFMLWSRQARRMSATARAPPCRARAAAMATKTAALIH